MRKVCRKREMGKMEADRQGGEDGAGQTDARKARRAAPTLRKLGFPLSIILPLPPSFLPTCFLTLLIINHSFSHRTGAPQRNRSQVRNCGTEGTTRDNIGHKPSVVSALGQRSATTSGRG